MVDQIESSELQKFAEGTQLVIDYKAAEELAKKYDFSGRDLMVHIDIDLGQVTPVNFILINPVIAGTSAFIKVIDVATSNANEEFKTVDGFSSQAFDKILTPEANKIVSNDIKEKTLAPSNFSYMGLGVFAFPVRLAQKVRLTLLAESPTPAIYERLHLIMQEIITINTKVKSSKKGLF